MSFLSVCRGFGTFVSIMVEQKASTLTLIKMKQHRVNSFIDDAFRCLELLETHKPFKDSIEVAERISLQEKFLNMAKHPDLVSNTLEPRWKVLDNFTSYNGVCLKMRISSNDNLFDFIVEKTITVYLLDSNYCRDITPIGSFDNVTEAFESIVNDEDDDESEVIPEDDENVIKHTVSKDMSTYLDKAFIDRNFD